MGRQSTSGARYLTKRADAYGLWQYYRNLPQDIYPKVIGEVRCHWSGRITRLEGRPVVVVSLGTTDRQEALVRRDMVHAEVEPIVQQAIRLVRKPGAPRPRLVAALSDEQRKALVDHAHAEALAEADARIVGDVTRSSTLLERLVSAERKKTEAEAIEELLKPSRDPIENPFEKEDINDFVALPLLDRVLADAGLEIIDPVERRRIALDLVRVSRRVRSDLAARDRGETVPTPVVIKPVFDEKEEKGPLLREVFEQFAGGLPNPRTAQDYRVHITRFVEIMGDVPLKTVTRKMVFDFATALQRFPVRYPDSWRSRPAPEIMALAAKRPGQKMMSPETINDKALAALSSTFSFACRRDIVATNPCAGVSLPVDSTAPKPRRKFEIGELKTIFSQGELTGIPQGASFWLPTLALYSGARLEELGQLRCSDVRRLGDVWYISISADGVTRVKTRSSERDVPIHRDIIGKLLSEIARISGSGSEWLFPELTPDRNGIRTAAFSKKFGKFLNRIGLEDPRLAFHSFRHTFLRKCRDSKIPKDVAEHLSGHAAPDVSSGYGSGYDLETLDEWLQRMKWTEVFEPIE
jgi:integrase